MVRRKLKRPVTQMAAWNGLVLRQNGREYRAVRVAGDERSAVIDSPSDRA